MQAIILCRGPYTIIWEYCWEYYTHTTEKGKKKRKEWELNKVTDLSTPLPLPPALSTPAVALPPITAAAAATLTGRANVGCPASVDAASLPFVNMWAVCSLASVLLSFDAARGPVGSGHAAGDGGAVLAVVR